jgi:acyl-CoA synthetase (AMP-forming)/AMP-acid ligase II
MNVAHFLEASARRAPERTALVFGEAEVLFEHPAVAEVAVLGQPDPIKGEVVRACVVVRPGLSTTAAELIEQCRGRVAPYKVPVVVEFLSALPKSPTGKILKKNLR